MKKINIILSAFALFVFFALPAVSKAALYEVTVTLSKMRIPERSAVLGKSADTEVGFSSYYYPFRAVAFDVTLSKVVSYKKFATTNPYVAHDGSSVNLFFPYVSGHTYRIYLEEQVLKNTSQGWCKADCEPALTGTGGWYYYFQPYYYVNGSWSTVSCPTNVCARPFPAGSAVAVDPASVYYDGSVYWFRYNSNYMSIP